MAEYRINGFDQIKALYSWVFNNQDKPINTTHISLYVFFINQNNRSNWVEWFKCPYDLGMTGSAIGSRNTYYKCLADLKEWGLIDYQKGINDYRAPLIKLLMLKNEQVQVPLSEQAPVLLPEHLPMPLCEHLPEHIYKLITDNLKQITNNEKEFFDFVLNLGKKKTDYSFVAPEFKDCFDLWMSYKKERRESYKGEKSLKACYNELLRLSNHDSKTALLIINQSMAANWAGMFELKEQVKKEDHEVLGYNESYINGKRMYNRVIEIPRGTKPCPSNMYHWDPSKKEFVYGN